MASKLLISIFGFFLFFENGYTISAQSTYSKVFLDSISASDVHDTVKINAAIDAVSELEVSDYEGAHEIARWSLNKSKKIGYDSGVLESYYWLASMEYENRNPEVMHIYIDSIIPLAHYDGYEQIMGDVYNAKGIAYYDENDYIRALQYWQKALELTPREKSSGLLSNIGNIYLSNEKLDDALEYYLKAVDINLEQKNYDYLVINYINIARCYTAEDTSQIFYLNLGAETARKASYTRMLPYFFFDMANYYAANYAFRDSYNYIDSLQAGLDEEPWKSDLTLESTTNYLYRLAMYKLQGAHELSETIPYAEEDVKTLLERARSNYEDLVSGTTNHRALVALHEYLASINSKLGDYKEATENYRMAYLYNDSLASNQAVFQLKQYEMDREKALENEAVLKANAERQRQRYRLTLALGAIGLFLILAIGLYTRLRFVNRSKALLKKEKDRSENLLLNILPEEIAQELKEKGKADARDFEMVSILFTDFKGFTEQSAKLSAAELVHEINHCFEAFDGIIEKYNVEKIKTIGDAYMAAGGLPVPTDDSVKNTVLAALEMQAFVLARKAAKNAKGEMAFEMRVGIHTGPVVAGIVGVKKFQYDIWGDTVNTASRIESNGEAGKVNISQATYELLKNDADFSFESRGKIEAKGKGEMEMWFVYNNN